MARDKLRDFEEYGEWDENGNAYMFNKREPEFDIIDNNGLTFSDELIEATKEVRTYSGRTGAQYARVKK